MKKFQTMGELIAYMVGANAPSELKTEAENQMQAVEEVNQSGATAYLVRCTSKAHGHTTKVFLCLYSKIFCFFAEFCKI